METTLILAVGEHGQLTTVINQYMQQLDSLERECETACKEAVGFLGVKTATELINSAQVNASAVFYTHVCSEKKHN